MVLDLYYSLGSMVDMGQYTFCRDCAFIFFFIIFIQVGNPGFTNGFEQLHRRLRTNKTFDEKMNTSQSMSAQLQEICDQIIL